MRGLSGSATVALDYLMGLDEMGLGTINDVMDDGDEIAIHMGW